MVADEQDAIDSLFGGEPASVLSDVAEVEAAPEPKPETVVKMSEEAPPAEDIEEDSHIHDLTVSTLVHLMGLPSQQQLAVVEVKLDNLANKVSALISRVDRLSKYVMSSTSDQSLDRIDFQLADIRTLLKKFLPKTASFDVSGKTEAEDIAAKRGQISLSSVPKPRSNDRDD